VWEGQLRPPRIVIGLAVAAVVLADTGGGEKPYHGRLHLVWLSLTASAGFPGPPSTNVTLDDSRTFGRVARLVPLPLPPLVPPLSPRGSKHPLTVCFPMDLAIGLSNGKTVTYPSCTRSPALQPAVRALCVLLRKRGFCAQYRSELSHRRSRF